jgi:hypothetical protein
MANTISLPLLREVKEEESSVSEQPRKNNRAQLLESSFVGKGGAEVDKTSSGSRRKSEAASFRKRPLAEGFLSLRKSSSSSSSGSSGRNRSKSVPRKRTSGHQEVSRVVV